MSLDLEYLKGEGPIPGADTEDAILLQKSGFAHEKNHLETLRSQGRSIRELATSDVFAAAIDTYFAMKEGVEIIYQGAVVTERWAGWADFIERVEKPSALGAYSYEIVDTKLKRSAHPKHVLQLVLYSDAVAKLQGKEPELAHVILGNGKRETLRLAHYAHYAREARKRLEAFIDDGNPTRPIPCADCALCRWAGHCESIWQAEDSLFNVANISRGQVKKLEAAGITTMAALAMLDRPVRGMAEGTQARLVTQARLQHDRKTGQPSYELRAPEPGKGFDLLPAPQPGDLFYDIEGDPHFEGGLEYLHGVWCDGQFRAFWAHDHEAEAKALDELLAFFRARLEAFPNARIYHYAAYEITALRRLTTKYGIGEAFLDRLQRERRFVDLFAVVRGGLIGSERNYSIKSMEAFYSLVREGEVKTAGGSVVAYERWRETGEQQILDEIEDYNRIDCISTEELRNWLVTIRPPGAWPNLAPDAGPKEADEDADVQALRLSLAASVQPEDRRTLLFNLGLFHKREAKPAWWAIFDSLGKEEEDLIEDLDALGGLRAVGPCEPVAQSVRRLYAFPQQETKLRAGQRPNVPTPEGFTSVALETMDRQARRLTLKIRATNAAVLADRLTLHPAAPVNADVIAQALRDVIADQCGPHRYRAVDDLLSRSAPRLTNGPLMPLSDPVTGMIAAVGAMDNTILPIQGPPGTGKTYVTARAILSLVKNGARVGVTSNSHEAIRNVLMSCLNALEEDDPDLRLDLIHKLGAGEDNYPEDCPVRRTTDNGEAAEGQHVVGATAWFFCRDENVQAFDWLFVDEAGQVGLANMVAMGRAARNIVLVGDPRQLPQVIQGAHPEPANLSCLEWMLGGHATVPPDRGIFLPVSRRMHPAVCGFISDQVYEGRLTSHPDTVRQSVRGTRFPKAGAFWVPVPHEGNAQIATEEVTAISAAVADLLTGTWTDKDGTTRPMLASDIMVVAPYNAQVNALRDALPDAVRVGTVDKFQGQESPICLVSMTASSAEETPRGMEFLFSLNRINVAVSRAKGLALVFGTPRLRAAKCDTIEQMRLVNALCALSELPIHSAGPA